MGQLLNTQGNSSTDVEGQQSANNPEVAWWCRLLARAVGVVGAAISLILGLWTCFGFSAICIGAGILQMLFALLVLMVEAPICFSWFQASRPIGIFAENRTFFQRAIVYCILGIIPIAICFGLSTLFGSGLLFAAGVLYGLMGLGKKADREQMARQAQGSEGPQAGSDEMKSNLIDNENTHLR